jgi:hypothetical protein
MPTQAELTELELITFCKEFVAQPYLCYTEHGLHARFFTQLYNAFAAHGLEREADFEGRQVGLIQKEYPTNHHFGRSRRQNWDTSVIEHPIVRPAALRPYDHFPLAAVVEFGLNCGPGHLISDQHRLSHQDSNVAAKMIAHVYRLSAAGNQISNRDLSPNSAAILPLIRIHAMAAAVPGVTVYYAMSDMTGRFANGVWRMTAQEPVQL